MATVYAGTDAWLARQPAIRDEVRVLAEQIQFAAEMFLAQHRVTGDMHIELRRGRRTDYFVYLVDSGGGAVPFEFGWIDEDGQFHEGANVMGRAADA